MGVDRGSRTILGPLGLAPWGVNIGRAASPHVFLPAEFGRSRSDDTSGRTEIRRKMGSLRPAFQFQGHS